MVVGKDMNEAQRRAAVGGGGVMLVIAGAGTGKTRTLVEKVGAIVREGAARPGGILVITFSRRAAVEVRERVRRSLGDAADVMTMGTFHSVCLGILREFSADYVPWAGFVDFPAVMDDAARLAMQRDLVAARRERFLGLPDDVVLSLAAGTRRLHPRHAAKLRGFGLEPEIERLAGDFRACKRARGVVDFDDLLAHVAGLLRERPELRRGLLERYRYILVDEFQDTARDTFAVLELLLPEVGRNLFLVGDDHQSVYAFRGARPEYLVGFRRRFPEAAIITLSCNYRSRKEILRVSNRLIALNRRQVRKRLVAKRGAGGLVVIQPVSGEREERDAVRSILAREREADGSVAVLYRNNWQGDALRRHLDAAGDESGIGFAEFMTMHASKGLEFDAVIVAGVADGVMPDPETDIEEERRLLYVAITRARERLYVIHRLRADGTPGRFANELRGGWRYAGRMSLSIFFRNSSDGSGLLK